MATNLSVYVGLWRDYSQDGVNQVILTIPLQWGNILVSVLALLVSMAGGATWRILAYILHQTRVRPSTRSDPFQQQVQTLLRNSATPISALVDSFCIGRAWAQTPYPAVRTLLPTGALAGMIIVSFGLFSIFVSAVATHSESNVNVLARPAENCGGWDFNWTVTGAVDKGVPDSLERLRNRVDDAVSARAYATWFYSRDKKPLAVTNTMFPVSKLSYETSFGPCPFLGTGRCLSNDTSTPNTTLVLDTGLLDSHYHLGINAPRKDRSSLRYRIECSPIDVSDMCRPLGEVNGTLQFDFSNFMNFSTSTLILPGQRELLNVGYTTGCYWWPGATAHLQWPVALSSNPNADITACTIAQNSVRYSSPVYDPLFLATNFSEPFYYGTNPFNTIACRQQVQFCNPLTGQCTNLTHAAQAYNESLGLHLNIDQFTAIKRSALLLGLTDVASLGVGSLGASGLLARETMFSDSLSLHLPPDHWQREATLWFETKLALLQSHIIRFLDRIDRTSPIYENTLVYIPVDKIEKGEERDAVERNCGNMRITTTGEYQNFQFWAVGLVIVFCVVIVGVSVLLETIMGLVRRQWVTREGRARQLARDFDSQYWLLRMALEGVGIVPWRRGGKKADSRIPVLDQVHELRVGGDYGDEFYKS